MAASKMTRDEIEKQTASAREVETTKRVRLPGWRAGLSFRIDVLPVENALDGESPTKLRVSYEVREVGGATVYVDAATFAPEDETKAVETWLRRALASGHDTLAAELAK